MKIGTLKAAPKTEWKDTELGDIRVLVSGLKTVEFRRKLEMLLTQPAVAKQIRSGGKREAEVRDQAFNKSLADTVLRDWENLTDDDDKPIPYEHITALQLITDSLSFRDAVVSAANEIDQERYISEEDVLGNSLPTSAGG